MVDSKLTEQQMKAVEYIDSPLLIVAGRKQMDAIVVV